MQLDFIKYAFSVGEMAPQYYGRPDLTKYDLGLALAYNGFIDYRGGFTSRAGFELVDYVGADDKETRLVRFKRGASDLLLQFGHRYMRVVENGAYVTHPTSAITAVTQADPARVTDTGHGYTTGDWIIIRDVVGMTELNTRTFQITVIDPNTYDLESPAGGANVDTTAYAAYVSGGTSEKIFTLTTTFTSQTLADLQFDQKLAEVEITSQDYDVHVLTYTDNITWTLAARTFGSDVTAPGTPTLTPSTAGTAGVGFAVSAVTREGHESQVSRMQVDELSVDYTTAAGSMLVEWTAVADAVQYNVYRTLVLPIGTEMTLAQELGYVGYSFGPQFTDNNITVDFTKTPMQNKLPFANSSVRFITITAGGTGYSKTATTVSVTGGGGSGFSGYPIINNAGVILGVVIVNGGTGYSTPVVAFAGGGGTGATATATLTEATGNYPTCSATFQQRRYYAGTENFPLNLWATVPNNYNNMDVSIELIASDAFEFTVDEDALAPILHMIDLRSGLLLFSNNGVSRITGSEGLAVNGLSAINEPQNFKGVSSIPPLVVDNDVIFGQADNTALHALAYTYYTNSFTAQDLSLFSNHLLDRDKTLVEMTWAEAPFKLIYAVRSDGALLTYTYLREQEVFAMTQNATRGVFKNAVALKENHIDRVYAVVNRYVNGRWTKFIEVQAERRHHFTEDFFCVDCGIASAKTYPDAELTFSASSGTGVTATSSVGSIFTVNSVGDMIFTGRGKFEITGFTSGSVVTGTWLRPMGHVQPEDDARQPIPQPSGDWYTMTPTDTVTNLWHLEGETVRVAADGDDLGDFVVALGTVELDRVYSKIRIGFPFTYKGKSLPLTSTQLTVEGKKKNVKGLAVRVHETRGLAFGALRKTDLDPINVYEMKDRTAVDWGDEIALRNDSSWVSVDALWEEDGSIYWEQTYALPATVLGYVVEATIGDVE